MNPLIYAVMAAQLGAGPIDLVNGQKCVNQKEVAYVPSGTYVRGIDLDQAVMSSLSRRGYQVNTVSQTSQLPGSGTIAYLGSSAGEPDKYGLTLKVNGLTVRRFDIYTGGSLIKRVSTPTAQEIIEESITKGIPPTCDYLRSVKSSVAGRSCTNTDKANVAIEYTRTDFPQLAVDLIVNTAQMDLIVNTAQMDLIVNTTQEVLTNSGYTIGEGGVQVTLKAVGQLMNGVKDNADYTVTFTVELSDRAGVISAGRFEVGIKNWEIADFGFKSDLEKIFLPTCEKVRRQTEALCPCQKEEAKPTGK